MSTLTDSEGYELVDAAGLTYTEGCAPPCCGIAPSAHYYKFEACPVGGSYDPCALPGPIPGLSTIYVAFDLTCSNSPGGTLTIEAMVLAALAANQTPVVKWAGWCYRFVDSCYFPTCPQTGTAGGFCGATCKPLPSNAQGPSGPVQCLTGCESQACRDASYVFFRACPGEGTLASPELYVCAADLYPFFAAGGRCPVYRINVGGADHCYYADWQNASATKPANYQRLQSSPSWDGCCLCLGPPCVYSEGAGCTDVGGFTGFYDPAGPFPPRCCAHALNGTASVTWSYRRYDALGLSEQKVGRADRSGLTLSGSWTRTQRTGPGQFQTEPFAVSGVFAASSHFTLISTIGADVNSSLGEKTWSGFPCPVGSGTFSGSWRSTCTTFTMLATVQGNGVRTEFAVTYACVPNAGLCAAGCATNTIAHPGWPRINTPVGPGVGDAGPGGMGDAHDEMMRRQFGHVCTGCGG